VMLWRASAKPLREDEDDVVAERFGDRGERSLPFRTCVVGSADSRLPVEEGLTGLAPRGGDEPADAVGCFLESCFVPRFL
jgi:hypothetical protein